MKNIFKVVKREERKLNAKQMKIIEDGFIKLKIEDGDIILMKADVDVACLEVLKNWLEKSGYKNVFIFIVNKFEDLVKLDEIDMARCGWLKNKNGKMKSKKSVVRGSKSVGAKSQK